LELPDLFYFLYRQFKNIKRCTKKDIFETTKQKAATQKVLLFKEVNDKAKQNGTCLKNHFMITPVRILHFFFLISFPKNLCALYLIFKEETTNLILVLVTPIIFPSYETWAFNHNFDLKKETNHNNVRLEKKFLTLLTIWNNCLILSSIIFLHTSLIFVHHLHKVQENKTQKCAIRSFINISFSFFLFLFRDWALLIFF